jgi:hypothetical protein
MSQLTALLAPKTLKPSHSPPDTFSPLVKQLRNLYATDSGTGQAILVQIGTSKDKALDKVELDPLEL